MSVIIYEQTPGALIAQPGRAVTTFPSGLCRVDQTYICTTASKAENALTLAVGNAMPDGDDSPSLETLAIHPQPQGIDRGDGFTEFRVSAYGQTVSDSGGTNRTLANIQLMPLVALGGALVGDPPDTSVPCYTTLWSITGMVVVPFGQVIDISQIDYDSELDNALNFYQTQGALLSYYKESYSDYYVTLQSGAVGLFRLSNPQMVINSYTNFGAFAEISVTIGRGVVVTEFA